MMKKIRGLTSFLLVAVLLLSTVFNGSLAFAADNITVEIDGQRVNFQEQQPVIKDGKTLVPVRGVFEKLGYTVSWEQSTQTATLSNGVNTVIITVGKSTFTTNGNTYSLDVPAQIINGKTMLPFRAVLESVGCSVDWNGSNNTVIVSSSNSVISSTPTPTPTNRITAKEGYWYNKVLDIDMNVIHDALDGKRNNEIEYAKQVFANGSVPTKEILIGSWEGVSVWSEHYIDLLRSTPARLLVDNDGILLANNLSNYVYTFLSDGTIVRKTSAYTYRGTYEVIGNSITVVWLTRDGLIYSDTDTLNWIYYNGKIFTGGSILYPNN